MPEIIDSRDRIPLGQKLMFAAGVNMDYVATGLMTGILWMPFFNIGLGMSPTVLGIVLMILRAWDAVTDPVMGNISDNARTRWGRRRPFMFFGAIATALLYPLFWYTPEGLGEAGKAVYLTLTGAVFFACFTTWSMPYYGLQLELTPNYDERTRLTAWMALFGKLSSLAGGWLMALVMLIGGLALGDSKVLEGKWEWLAGLLARMGPWLRAVAAPEDGEKAIVVGMRICCWLIVPGILVFGLLPPLFVKERYYQAEAGKQSRDPFWKSLGESARCKPLWSLIAISFFLVLGSTSVSSLGQYVNFYYVNHGDLSNASVIAGWKGTAIVVAGVLGIPIFTWLGEKWDKRGVVMAMLGCSMAGHLLNYVCMTPEHPYLQIVPGVFESSALAAVWLFLPSMKADVADWDEQHTHRRREGSINAFFSWFIKASLTCSMGLGGWVLSVSGFDAKLPAQPQAVLNRMFLLYLILPSVIWAGAMAAAWFYPLNRARCSVIRRELEARRGTL